MMPKQLTYEDVKEGMEITPLIKETSPRMSAEWAGASGDYDPIHYDKEYAKARRFPSAVVNGRLKVAWLIQTITNWIGDEGVLKRISCRHVRADIVGEPVKCKGIVIRKFIEDGEHLVECEIWTENPKAERTTPGKAIVALSLKA